MLQKEQNFFLCCPPQKILHLVLLPSPKMQINAEWGIWNVLLSSTRRGSASIFSCWWNPILDLATRLTQPKDLPYLVIYDGAKEISYGFLRQDRIGTAGWSVSNSSSIQSHRLLWQNRGLLGWEGTNPEFLVLSSSPYYPWKSASSLRESVTAWKIVQYILLFLYTYIHIVASNYPGITVSSTEPAAEMAEQSVCSNTLQSTFSSWSGKNFSSYNWISSSNNLDSLLTSSHGCTTLNPFICLSASDDGKATALPCLWFHSLCHTSRCQLILHHEAGWIISKTGIWIGTQRFKPWHRSWIINHFCICLCGSNFSPQKVPVRDWRAQCNDEHQGKEISVPGNQDRSGKRSASSSEGEQGGTVLSSACSTFPSPTFCDSSILAVAVKAMKTSRQVTPHAFYMCKFTLLSLKLQLGMTTIHKYFTCPNWEGLGENVALISNC